MNKYIVNSQMQKCDKHDSSWLKKFEHFKFLWMKGFWHPLKDPAVILGSRHIVSLQNKKQHEKPMCHTDQTVATLLEL